MSEVFIVTAADELLGIFDNKAIASEFASHFVGAEVAMEELQTKMPDLYGWRCRVTLSNREMITEKCVLQADPILVQIDSRSLTVMGKTKEDAEQIAKDYLDVVAIMMTQDDPVERVNAEFKQHSESAKETGIPRLSPEMQQAIVIMYGKAHKKHKKHTKDNTVKDPVEVARAEDKS